MAVTKQPTGTMISAAPASHDDSFANAGLDAGVVHLPSLAEVKAKLTTREGWLGSYDYSFLCMPQLPCFQRGKKIKASPFYALDQPLPISIAAICGFQHSLAMLAGLITPPIIFSGQLGFSGATQNQMVAVSLIASGFLSAIQMSRFRIPFTGGRYYLGTGLITVVGTSFATLSTAASIFNALYADGTCPTIITDGVSSRGPCPAAYGYLLGTAALCSLFGMLLAFVPVRALKRIFPPIVTGTVVLLIGVSLISASGFKNWGGGSGPCFARPAAGIFQRCPTNFAPNALQWGDARYIGLGFLSFITIILIEFVGSPAMKSSSIILGLVVGCIVAGPLGYISASTIKSAPSITFLWVQTYPLKIYGPAILPMIAVQIALAMEAIGDITASSEASRQPVDGLLFDSRIQGGVLGDAVNCLISALMMNPPVSIFAQNNGVISITRCANRISGYFCAFFLVLFGILAKLSGVFLAIPASVLGGVTTFLFASVAISGLKVISLNQFTRRDRVILAAAFSLGFGNLLVPSWSEHIFTYAGPNKALEGFLNSLLIIIDTPFLIGGLTASLLNGFLPADPEASPVEHEDDDIEDRPQSVEEDHKGH